MGAIAHKRQHVLVDAHIAAGGERASSWAAADIGLAILVPVFVVAVIVGVLSAIQTQTPS